jgi:hypothetical protein
MGDTKRANLSRAITFLGEDGIERTYGPGENVEVPADFPLDGDIEASSEPTPERIFRKPSSTPPNTGGVDTGEGRHRSAVSGGVTPTPVSTSETSGTVRTPTPTTTTREG